MHEAKEVCLVGPFKTVSIRGHSGAEELLQEVYGPGVSIRVGRNATDFSLDFGVAEIGELRVARSTFRNYNCSRSIGQLVQFFFVVQGRGLQHTVGAQRNLIGCGHGGFIGPEQDMRHLADNGSVVIVSMPIERFVSRAGALSGRACDQEVRAASGRQGVLQGATAGALARTGAFVLSETRNISMWGGNSLVASAYEEMLLSLAVPAILPALFDGFADPKPTSKATVDQVRDHIVAAAAEPIDLGALAISLGISLRSLQLSFKKRFGVSPRQYIQDCRLQRAAALLSDPDQKSVIAVALASGFSNLGHFAKSYALKYGELPSATLKRAKSR